jgi:hypothetical protein
MTEQPLNDLGQCRELVAQPPHYLHWFQCERKAKQLVGEKAFCTQHAKIRLRRTPGGSPREARQ